MDIVQQVPRMREIGRVLRSTLAGSPGAPALGGAGTETKRIGLVPTMGALHEGHLSLVRAARAAADVVVLSVFVNPAQFGPGEDFESYPRTLARDAELAADAGVDVLFAPEAKEMYPPGSATFVEVTGLSDVWCGASRPGHFRGVATVVLKLFEIVRPHVAVFGRKDYQQSLVVRRMTEDLQLGVEIVTAPIVREADGLAMSSRNARLSPEERAAAPVLHKALAEAVRLWKSGVRDGDAIETALRDTLAGEPLVRIDYAKVADPETLTPLVTSAAPVNSAARVTSAARGARPAPGEPPRSVAIAAVAAWLGKTRLIDNTLLEGDR